MTWLLLPAALLVVAMLPWLAQTRRKPITDALRDTAPGQFADLSAGKTHYVWHGPDHTRILVLIHGLSTPEWVFCGLTRGLVMAGYRVLSYDLYGRGFSDRPHGKQTLQFHTQQLGELLDALGLDAPVSLMGYSMGGAIAASFAADQPERVERLILLAPAGIRYLPGPLLSFARKSGPFGGWLWGLFGGAALRRSAKADARAPTVIPDLAQRIVTEISRKGYLPAILSSERHSLHQPMQEVHREIAAMYIPTLAIWGEADPVIPITAAGDFAQLHRKAHQEVIPGAGHGLAYTNPTEVLAAIKDFLHDIPD